MTSCSNELDSMLHNLVVSSFLNFNCSVLFIHYELILSCVSTTIDNELFMLQASFMDMQIGIMIHPLLGKCRASAEFVYASMRTGLNSRVRLCHEYSSL